MSTKLIEYTATNSEAEFIEKKKPLISRLLSRFKQVLFRLSLGQYSHKLYHEGNSRHSSWTSAIFTIVIIGFIFYASILFFLDIFNRSHFNISELSKLVEQNE